MNFTMPNFIFSICIMFIKRGTKFSFYVLVYRLMINILIMFITSLVNIVQTFSNFRSKRDLFKQQGINPHTCQNQDKNSIYKMWKIISILACVDVFLVVQVGPKNN